MIEVFFRGHGCWLEVSTDFSEPDSLDVDQISQNTLTSGVFSLCLGDEIAYRHTDKLEGISYLYPSEHPDSHFLTLNRDCNRKYTQYCFKIDTKSPMTLVIARPTRTKAKTELKETERQTMLKLIIGMAMDAYGHDPQNHRNNATGANKGSIRAALERKGICMDEETVRKYLNEAKTYYSPQSQ